MKEILNNMYKSNSLKGLLMNYLKTHQTLIRTNAHQLIKKWGYEYSNGERRLRELANEMGVTPLNDRMKPADIFNSEHIFAYRYKPTTKFYAK